MVKHLNLFAAVETTGHPICSEAIKTKAPDPIHVQRVGQ